MSWSHWFNRVFPGASRQVMESNVLSTSATRTFNVPSGLLNSRYTTEYVWMPDCHIFT